MHSVEATLCAWGKSIAVRLPLALSKKSGLIVGQGEVIWLGLTCKAVWESRKGFVRGGLPRGMDGLCGAVADAVWGVM